MNNYQYQLIGESIWNTYRDIAVVFLEAKSAEEHADIITKRRWSKAHEEELKREQKKWGGIKNPLVKTRGTRFDHATPESLKRIRGIHHVGAREGQVAGRRRETRLARQADLQGRIGVVGVGLRKLGRRIRGALA